MDKRRSEKSELIPDMCSCGRGRLHKGITKYVFEVENEVIIITNVPAWICDLCDEAYITPEVSKKIDEIMRAFRAGKLLARPIAAGQVELSMSA
jgi:YgiT-type zinc finger domain-containing protein